MNEKSQLVHISSLLSSLLRNVTAGKGKTLFIEMLVCRSNWSPKQLEDYAPPRWKWCPLLSARKKYLAVAYVALVAIWVWKTGSPSSIKWGKNKLNVHHIYPKYHFYFISVCQLGWFCFAVMKAPEFSTLKEGTKTNLKVPLYWLRPISSFCSAVFPKWLPCITFGLSRPEASLMPRWPKKKSSATPCLWSLVMFVCFKGFFECSDVRRRHFFC